MGQADKKDAYVRLPTMGAMASAGGERCAGIPSYASVVSEESISPKEKHYRIIMTDEMDANDASV